MTIDLRDDGFTYAEPMKTGRPVRWYGVFGVLAGDVGDEIIWRTPGGDMRGRVTSKGVEFLPNPTPWIELATVEPLQAA